MEEDLEILFNHKLNKISKAEACKDCITYISKMNMFIGINISLCAFPKRILCTKILYPVYSNNLWQFERG